MCVCVVCVWCVFVCVCVCVCVWCVRVCFKLVILQACVQIYDYLTNGCLHHVRAVFLLSFICKVCSKGILPETIVLLKENCRQIEAIAMEAVEEEERAVSLSSAERQY